MFDIMCNICGSQGGKCGGHLLRGHKEMNDPELNNPVVEDKMRQICFFYEYKQTLRDRADYERMFKQCPNPPPCMGCHLSVWAFCRDTEYSCPAFNAYVNDPKAEKQEFKDEEDEEECILG